MTKIGVCVNAENTTVKPEMADDLRTPLMLQMDLHSPTGDSVPTTVMLAGAFTMSIMSAANQEDEGPAVFLALSLALPGQAGLYVPFNTKGAESFRDTLNGAIVELKRLEDLNLDQSTSVVQ